MMRKLYLLIMFLFCATFTLSQNGPLDDFDGDGIVNQLDIDDDNDGIPDDVESICRAYVTDVVASSIENVNNSDNIIGEPDNAGARFRDSSYRIIVDFGLVLPAGTNFRFRAAKSGSADRILTITPAPNGDYNTLGNTTQFTITNNSYNSVPEYIYTLTSSTQYLAIGRTGSSSSIYVDYISYPPNQCASNSQTDADGDGIIDKFDIDSDADGCPDALEGAGVTVLLSNLYLKATSSDPYKNGMIKGGVDANGLPNIFNGTPQELGTSDNTFEKADECDFWCTIEDGPDTDGDGRGDECDVDDDNDGILDVDEGLICYDFGFFFDGQRDFYQATNSNGTLRDAKPDDVMVLQNFIRELDANGNQLIGGATYDIRVELKQIYPGNATSFNQVVDFDSGLSSSGDELVVLTGGPPSSNPFIVLDITFIEHLSASASNTFGSPIGLSDATIQFSDIDSSTDDNYTDVVGVKQTPELITSGPVLNSDNTFLERGGFAASPITTTVTNINNDYALYRLKKDPTNTASPWKDASNVAVPNPTRAYTAGFIFDQFESMTVVWGYTTDGTEPSQSTYLTRGLSFARGDVQFCIYEDTDKDGIPNEEDLDSDGDGCPDAKEASGDFNNLDLVVDNSIPGGNTATADFPDYNGTTTTPNHDNLGVPANSYGVPNKVNNGSDNRNNTQGIGESQNININGCSCEITRSNSPVLSETKIGISALNRGVETWLNDYNSGFIALESSTLGFAPTQIDNPETDVLNPIIGMIVWDNDDNCIKLYDGSVWRCMRQGCNTDISHSRITNQTISE